MSTKICFFKKATCFMVILVLMLTSLSTTALAADQTKTVTCETTYTYYVSIEEVPIYLGSPRSYVPLTHYYDDGIYKGTLNIATITGYPTYLEGEDYLEVKIYVTYSGTVSAYVTTKNVTRELTFSFLIHQSQLPFYRNYPSSFVPSTYNYDDGTYEGILYLTNSMCFPPNGITGDFVWVTIFTRYSGTVQLK